MHYTSRSLARLPNVAKFLSRETSSIVGWGLKPSGKKAIERGARTGQPFLLLEDGFLRSVERMDAPLSLVIDDAGMYYDAGAPSRLERLISASLSLPDEARTLKLIEEWRRTGVSKYNSARDYDGPLPEKYVLVCDQTFGDAAIGFGQADASSFAAMLNAALSENPDCEIVVKTHPDIFTRGKQGYFPPDKLRARPRVHIVAENCHPTRLIANAAAVYVVTSQMGFEALIWGKKVRCFGMPFYAGWGLTEDELPAPARRQSKASIANLVHASLITYPRYLDPETGDLCEVERAVEHIALQRKMRGEFPKAMYAVGFSIWKRTFIKRYLAGSEVTFVKRGRQVPTGSTVALWGRSNPDGLPEHVDIIRIEDGFLRSVGLGADLTRPMSLVFDDLGLYFDASAPSRLEYILENQPFDEVLLGRAARLREMILEAKLTKYNLEQGQGSPRWRRPESQKRVILVVGQVEADASIRFGSPVIATNIELLKIVRQDNPTAYIVYKPHPDVVAGLRAQGAGETSANMHCDEILPDGDIGHLFEEIDELATLTSLAGFEALLRGKAVNCYGQPFYSGWGLTNDRYPVSRRTRRLRLDELVAGALIVYPRYLSRVSRRFSTPERIVTELATTARPRNAAGRSWQKAKRIAIRLIKALQQNRTPAK